MNYIEAAQNLDKDRYIEQLESYVKKLELRINILEMSRLNAEAFAYAVREALDALDEEKRDEEYRQRERDKGTMKGT